MNIFITWTSRWIWKFLKDNLQEHNIFDISGRSECDIWDFEKLKTYLKEKIPENVALDGLVLNAGFGLFGKFEDFDFADYQALINTNLLWNIAILKFLEKNLHPRTKIIFIGSIISKKFMKWASVYQASKFGLRGLAGGLKTEWKKVFIINPKIVDTDFHKWKVCINPNWEKTSLESILESVKNILNGKERRFEIDL